MAKINKHIEIVSSSKPSLSSMSKRSRSSIKKVLENHYQHVNITLVDTPEQLQRLVDKKPDIVFLGMQFVPEDPRLGINSPDKIWLEDYLSKNDIVTTGSRSLAHEIESNKPFAKKRLMQEGLATSAYFVADNVDAIAPDLLPGEYPLFVKPSNRGGGLGIDAESIVTNLSELKSKVNSIVTNYSSSALIETYLPGREFSVSIIKIQERDEYVALPIELVAPEDETGARILGSTAKSMNTEEVSLVPEGKLKESLCTLALDSFRVVGGRDYGRIDIKMDSQGVPHFLEANLLPSLIDDYGSFPKTCKLGLGLNHEEMILMITDLAAARLEDALSNATREYTTTPLNVFA